MDVQEYPSSKPLTNAKKHSSLKCWPTYWQISFFFKIAFCLIINEIENLFIRMLAIFVLILPLSFYIFFSFSIRFFLLIFRISLYILIIY